MTSSRSPTPTLEGNPPTSLTVTTSVRETSGGSRLGSTATTR